MADARDAEFVGTHHRVWLDAIRKMKEVSIAHDGPLYSNQVAVCQSSGYGKSRTIREMSRLVLTIPL